MSNAGPDTGADAATNRKIRNTAALLANLVYYRPRLRDQIIRKLGYESNLKEVPILDTSKTRDLHKIKQKYDLFTQQNAFYSDENAFYWAQRGTHTADDVWYDWIPIFTPTRENNTERRRMAHEIGQWLFRYGNLFGELMKDKKVVFCGHSLGATLAATVWQEQYRKHEVDQGGKHFARFEVYAFAPFANPWLAMEFNATVNPENIQNIRKKMHVEYVYRDHVAIFVDSIENFVHKKAFSKKHYAPNAHSGLNFLTEQEAKAFDDTPINSISAWTHIGAAGYTFHLHESNQSNRPKLVN